MNTDELQEHENRGYEVAQRLLTAGFTVNDTRMSTHAIHCERTGDRHFLRFAGQTRWSVDRHRHEARVVVQASSRLFHVWMAGCELAIEEHEATHEG